MNISFDNKIFLLSLIFFFLAGILPAFAGEYIGICRFIMAGAIISLLYLLIKEYGIPACSKFNRFARVYFFVYLLMGIPYIFNFNWGDSNFPVDFAAFSFLIIGWRFYEIPANVWKYALLVILVLTIVCFVYTKQWDTMMLVASYDKGLGHSTYSTYAYMMVFASFIMPATMIGERFDIFEKYKWFFYVAIGLAFLICLITQKRALLIDTSLLLIYILVLRFNKINFGYILSLLVLFFVVSYLLRFIGIDIISTLLNGIFDRYKDINDNYAEFDRLVETKKWLSTASPFDVVFGLGLGSFQDILSFTNFHLHLGWPNLMFKGGIILFIAVAFTFISNIRFGKKHYSETKYKALLYFTLLLSIHLVHSPSWGYSLDAMALSMVLYSQHNLS